VLGINVSLGTMHKLRDLINSNIGILDFYLLYNSGSGMKQCKVDCCSPSQTENAIIQIYEQMFTFGILLTLGERISRYFEIAMKSPVLRNLLYKTTKI